MKLFVWLGLVLLTTGSVLIRAQQQPPSQDGAPDSAEKISAKRRPPLGPVHQAHDPASNSGPNQGLRPDRPVPPPDAPSGHPDHGMAQAGPRAPQLTTPSPSEPNPGDTPASQSTSNPSDQKRPSAGANQASSPAVAKPGDDKVAADLIPEGQELVNIDFPEPTDIKDIIRAVSLWTGKNVIMGRDVAGKVQMISPRKVTKAEAYQAFLSALNVLGLTTVETGKVIKIVPTRNAIKDNLKTYLGSSWTPLTDELITQIVPLKYIGAKELQTTLSRIVTANSMIAYQPTNTLIISDSGYKVRRILDIIELLDVQTQQPKVAIVPIKYADAKTIATMVGDIFNAQKSSSSRKASSASYLNYKILTDERTNSVIIFGPPRTISDVKQLVKQFDTPVEDASRQASIHVRPLDYADAQKLASTLSALAQGSSSSVRRPPVRSTRRSKSSSRSSSVTPSVANLDDDVKVTADESTNSLLITGSRSAFESLNSIIRKLDIRRSQVFVEAEILDINLDGGFKFGTSVFAGAGSEQGSKMAYTWEANQLAPLIVSQATGNKDSTTKTSAAGVFSEDLNIGILSGKTVNVPGLGAISPGALIKMIKTDSASRVLSSPHILTLNNEEANITVGDKLYYRTNKVSTSGVAVEDVKSEDVDLSLNIKPNISHANYVTLEIKLEANSGRIDSERRVPTVAKRKSSQIVTVKNGQTVVISGLVKTSELEVYQKIPLLGDIPILGWLFRNSEIRKVKSSLMIFLTPHIIHGANDLAAVYQQKIAERDELLKVAYGSNYQKDDFYKLLPTLEDGAFRADLYDILDEKNRQKLNKEKMRNMGYSDQDFKTMEEQKNHPGGSTQSHDTSEKAPATGQEVEPQQESESVIPMTPGEGSEMELGAPDVDQGEIRSDEVPPPEPSPPPQSDHDGSVEVPMSSPDIIDEAPDLPSGGEEPVPPPVEPPSEPQGESTE